MNYFIFTCNRTGETQDHYVCDRHATHIVVDGDRVQAYDCDDDIACEECESIINTGTPQQAHDAIVDQLFDHLAIALRPNLDLEGAK